MSLGNRIAFVSAVLLNASGVSALNYLTISPEHPGPTDSVKVLLSTTFGYAGYTFEESQVLRTDRSLTVDVTWRAPMVGLPVVLEYAHSEPLGLLAPGEYDLTAHVYVRATRNGQTQTVLVDGGSTRFAVTPEPGSAVLLMALGAVTVLRRRVPRARKGDESIRS